MNFSSLSASWIRSRTFSRPDGLGSCLRIRWHSEAKDSSVKFMVSSFSVGSQWDLTNSADLTGEPRERFQIAEDFLEVERIGPMAYSMSQISNAERLGSAISASVAGMFSADLVHDYLPGVRFRPEHTRNKALASTAILSKRWWNLAGRRELDSVKPRPCGSSFQKFYCQHPRRCGKRPRRSDASIPRIVKERGGAYEGEPQRTHGCNHYPPVNDIRIHGGDSACL